MEKRIKHFLWLRIGILSLILYCPAIILYLLFFYKPIKLLDISGITKESMAYDITIETNNMTKSFNRDNIIIFLVIALMICLAISIVMIMVYDEIILHTKPVITVSAKVKLKEKRMNVSTGGFLVSISTVSESYFITFEVDDGSEIKFMVSPKQYLFAYEGNKGILRYRHGLENRLVDFDIQEV